MSLDNAEEAVLRAKISERKTVHEWLNIKGIPQVEATGKRMCLLRRLAVALEIQNFLAPGHESGSLHPDSSSPPMVGSGAKSNI